jgi:hypothetical protein
MKARKATAVSRVLCRTPTPGKQGTRIDKAKYEMVRAAIRKVVPRHAQGMAFKDLADRVATHFTLPQRQALGSLLWYVVTVKLHMETLGEVVRVPGAKPQRIRLAR